MRHGSEQVKLLTELCDWPGSRCRCADHRYLYTRQVNLSRQPIEQDSSSNSSMLSCPSDGLTQSKGVRAFCSAVSQAWVARSAAEPVALPSPEGFERLVRERLGQIGQHRALFR